MLYRNQFVSTVYMTVYYCLLLHDLICVLFWQTALFIVCFKSLCLRCEGSAEMLPAFFLSQDWYKSWIEGKLVPLIFSATCCFPVWL